MSYSFILPDAMWLTCGEVWKTVHIKIFHKQTNTRTHICVCARMHTHEIDRAWTLRNCQPTVYSVSRQELKYLITCSPGMKHFCELEVSPYLRVNPLNAELNPICYLLALLAHHFLHVSRIRVKLLTLRLLMSYIYGAPILDVSRSHTMTQHSR